MYSFLVDNSEHKKAKGVNKNVVATISHNECKDVLLNDKCIRHSMNNIQAQEVIFSRKINKIDHPPLYFNQNLVKSSSTHKHLGMALDTRLDFNLHLKNVQNKVNKTIGLFRKLQNTLPRTSFITVFKSFMRPHLDYEDKIYD